MINCTPPSTFFHLPNPHQLQSANHVRCELHAMSSPPLLPRFLGDEFAAFDPSVSLSFSFVFFGFLFLLESRFPSRAMYLRRQAAGLLLGNSMLISVHFLPRTCTRLHSLARFARSYAAPLTPSASRHPLESKSICLLLPFCCSMAKQISIYDQTY